MKQLYHLSEVNHDGEYFYPRIPQSIMVCGYGYDEYEDSKTKRVCFSTSISGAYTAIQFSPTNNYQTMYVHVPYKPIHERYIKTPTDKQVVDTWMTGEKWVNNC